jgi:hypothetical protein
MRGDVETADCGLQMELPLGPVARGGETRVATDKY